MKNSEFSHIALTARKSIEDTERKWVYGIISTAEDEMVKKIRATPREKEWRVHVNNLGQYTRSTAYNIIKRYKADLTELEIIFSPDRDKQDSLYFKFKMEDER